MKGSKRMVPLEEVRASLLTIVTPGVARRERRRRGGGTRREEGDNLDGHGEGEEVRFEDERKESWT